MRIKQARIWLCYCLLSGTLGAACGGDLGNSISTGGGVTSFGGTQASGGGGGQGGSAGASGTDCPLYTAQGCTTVGADCPTKSEQDCTPANNCSGIYGLPSGDVAPHTFVYEGCMSSAPGCAAVITCANPAGHPENCVWFTSGCIPVGWTESVSCPLPGC